jgi:uncharacterized protein YbaR (Trm112 family)
MPNKLTSSDACPVCRGRCWIISERDDGINAIEACDNCRQFHRLTDDAAARMAVEFVNAKS